MTLARHAAAALLLGTAMALAGPVHADPGCTPGACPSTDVDFTNQLHTYGIYGPRDYNAWIGKTTCKRLDTGLDADASTAQKFVRAQLPRQSTDVQAWQFVGTAITYYCPDQAAVLQRVSAPHI